MHDFDQFERRLAAALRTDADRSVGRFEPGSVARAAMARAHGRTVRTAWRSSIPNALTRLAAAAVIGAAVVGGAFYLLGGRPGVGGPSTSPNPSASASAVATELPSTGPSLPSLDVATWVDFTSARYGISAKFPPGWAVKAATAPWIGQLHDPGPEFKQDVPFGDAHVASDSATSTDGMAFFITSQAIPSGKTEAAWWYDYLGTDVCPHCTPGKVPGPSAACFPKLPSDAMPITVDGQQGYEHGGLPSCNFTEVVVLVGGRAYQLTAYVNVNVDHVTGRVFDQALFDAWLSTIHFDPAGADDAPPASPAAS